SATAAELAFVLSGDHPDREVCKHDANLWRMSFSRWRGLNPHSLAADEIAAEPALWGLAHCKSKLFQNSAMRGVLLRCAPPRSGWMPGFSSRRVSQAATPFIS